MSRTPRVLARTAGALTLAGVAALAWGTLVERQMFTLRRVNVPVLPAGTEPIRILHLSDLHMAPWQRRKQAWVRGLAAELPDLVVNTGDNLGHADGIAGIELAMTNFAGIPGVYVNGSNDYYGPMRKNWLRYFRGPSKAPDGSRKKVQDLDTERLESFFTDGLHWTSLNNAATELTVRGTTIGLFGVDDPHIGRDRLDLLTGILDDLSDEGTDEGTSPDVVIGVTHAPYQRVLNSFVTHGAEVILAGHTHGGQVCIPGFGALVTNCDVPRRQVRGLSIWRHMFRSAFLNVSAGLGTSIFAPVRFACRPEATLVTLTPRRPVTL